jgi:hypothetical protein
MINPDNIKKKSTPNFPKLPTALRKALLIP